ncbi:hypothetical protein HMPREF9012_0672 [Bacteroidetes bacterium oral taxon 272 str. F0290]|nr:hypothetical protein HMPREF9012_0672 [Bacteroidetes bacterium oral taxon 272 str. F0290]
MVALLTPQSSYGRMANNLFQPVWLWGNNVLTALTGHSESKNKLSTQKLMKS